MLVSWLIIREPEGTMGATVLPRATTVETRTTPGCYLGTRTGPATCFLADSRVREVSCITIQLVPFATSVMSYSQGRHPSKNSRQIFSGPSPPRTTLRSVACAVGEAGTQQLSLEHQRGTATPSCKGLPDRDGATSKARKCTHDVKGHSSPEIDRNTNVLSEEVCQEQTRQSHRSACRSAARARQEQGLGSQSTIGVRS